MASHPGLGVLACLIAGSYQILVARADPWIDCNDGQFYIRADPTSCSHFYKCDHGNPVSFTCPAGLYFNPALHVCDWPYNVKCSNNGQRPGSDQNNKRPTGQHLDNNNNNNNYEHSYKPSQDTGAYNYNNQGNQNSGTNTNPSNNYQKPNNNYNQNPPQNTGSYTNNDSNKNNGNHAPSNDVWQTTDNHGKPNNGETNAPQTQPQYDEHGEDDDDSWLFPVQTPANVLGTGEGPTLQYPPGPLDRPRPTVDDLISGSNHPYQDYLGPQIDVRSRF